MIGAGRRVFAVVMMSAVTVFAQRPPPRQHAPAKFFEPADGSSPGARFLATLTPSERETLRKEGRVVLAKKSNGDELVRAVIRFERSPEQVFKVITQPSQQHKYLPHVSQSKSVGGRTPEGESVDLAVSFFVVSFKYRVQHWFYPEELRMEWTLDPAGGKGLAKHDGYFQLYALDENTTIADYGTRVATQDKFLDFLRGLGERGGIEDALTALRRHVHTAR